MRQSHDRMNCVCGFPDNTQILKTPGRRPKDAFFFPDVFQTSFRRP